MRNVIKFERSSQRRATARAGHHSFRSFWKSLTLTVILSAFVGIAAALVLDGGFFTNTQVPALASETIIGRASIIDGDTIEIHDQRIRLHGIDAPESAQICRDGTGRDYRCGQRAAIALADKIGQQTVSCEQRDIDQYRRIVAVCRAGGEDLNGWLVSEGWAIAYRRYSRDYVRAEDDAKAAKRGIWAGTFATPEEWRHGKSGQAAKEQTPSAEQPTACVIKGNISINTGERIYHVPGGRYYDQTKISPSKGERWFCSEAEARAAGWRRSKR